MTLGRLHVSHYFSRLLGIRWLTPNASEVPTVDSDMGHLLAPACLSKLDCIAARHLKEAFEAFGQGGSTRRSQLRLQPRKMLEQAKLAG